MRVVTFNEDHWNCLLLSWELKNIVDYIKHRIETNKATENQKLIYQRYLDGGVAALTEGEIIHHVLRMRENKNIFKNNHRSEMKSMDERDYEHKKYISCQEEWEGNQWNGVHDQATQKITEVHQYLNKGIECPHQRTALVASMLNNGQDKSRVKISSKSSGHTDSSPAGVDDFCEWIFNYYGAPMFINRQIKGATARLSDKDVYCLLLEMIADYMLFTTGYRELEYPYYYHKGANNEFYSGKRRTAMVREIAATDSYDFQAYEESSTNKNGVKRYKRVSDKVTEHDRKQYSELQEIHALVTALEEALITDKYPNGMPVSSRKEVRRQIKELRMDEKYTRNELKQRMSLIYKNNIMNNFDIFSDDQFTLSDPKMVAVLIDAYYDLKTSQEWQPLSSTRELMMMFDSIVPQANLTEKQFNTLTLRIEHNMSDKEIFEWFKQEGMVTSSRAITDTLNRDIPKKIAKQNQYIEGIIHHKRNRMIQWKVCEGHCNMTLPNTRDYFRLYRNECKKCESEYKNKKTCEHLRAN